MSFFQRLIYRTQGAQGVCALITEAIDSLSPSKSPFQQSDTHISSKPRKHVRSRSTRGSNSAILWQDSVPEDCSLLPSSNDDREASVLAGVLKVLDIAFADVGGCRSDLKVICTTD